MAVVVEVVARDRVQDGQLMVTTLRIQYKVNDIHYFDLEMESQKFRYIKAVAKNTGTPYWHHAAGLPSWIFADEIIID
ncbi:hypothetical protein BFP77_00070 [Maribacter sp. 4U21]|uniref:hypothetical protein n=1 Tax=Maribacter sp. 4U21 TaxID=1889779 RepID=UPI000C1475E1|nr:hypothetical protein [Maribacter sp. 4U21]PIB28372.1 hypothetical protein BFP77_00070 [Maribacter sp. 4U21]